MCDASDTAIGNILSQDDSDGRERPVALISKKMSESFKNKPPYVQEFLAIYHCVKKWRCYLEGTTHPVSVRTDEYRECSD